MHARLERLRERTNGYTVTPSQYVVVAYVALGALTLVGHYGRRRSAERLRPWLPGLAEVATETPTPR